MGKMGVSFWLALFLVLTHAAPEADDKQAADQPSGGEASGPLTGGDGGDGDSDGGDGSGGGEGSGGDDAPAPPVDPADQANVVIATEKTFADVTKGPLTLVEFFAPWCGHCQNLAPHYAKAATQLKGKVVLAQLDGTKDETFVEKLGIEGFPMLWVYKNGQKVGEYEGEHNTESIVSYLEKKSQPDFTVLSDAASFKAATAEKSFVGFFESEDSSKAFKDLAPAISAPVLIVTSKVLATSLGASSFPSYAAYLGGEKQPYTGDADAVSINAFVKALGLPLIIDYDTEAASLAGLDESTSLLVYRFNAKDQAALTDVATALAKANKNKVQVVKLNSNVSENAAFRKEIGLFEGPGVFAYIPTKGSISYPTAENPAAPVTVAAVTAWLEDCYSGKIRPALKSAPVPTQSGPVVELVGSNYVAKTSEGNDVLVMHYLPWCQFCKKMKPVMKSLAESFVGQSKVVIAQINVEENDVPSSVEGESFPAFYFWAAGAAQPVSLPEDVRTLKALSAFIVKNSKTGATAPADSSAKKGDKADL